MPSWNGCGRAAGSREASVAKKTSSKSETVEPSGSGLLPVPETVIRHHGPTLFTPMREWVSSQRMPPVLLLTGTAGSAKRNIAYWLAQWILCERSGFARHAPLGAVNEEE